MKGGQIEKKLLGLFYLREKSLLKEDADTFARSQRLAAVVGRVLDQRGAKNPEFWEPMEKLTFFVTRACQLRCRYCYVSKFQGHMPLAVARRGVELLMAGRRKNIELHFIGGEPLMKFDLIKKTVELAEQLKSKFGKATHYRISTNGFALSDGILDFFQGHRFCVAASLDGGEETFGAQRAGIGGRNFYQKIVSNLEKLKRRGMRYEVTVVASPQAVSHLEQNVLSVAALGHNRITLNYQTGCYWPKEALRELLKGVRDVAELARRHKRLEFINAMGESEWVEPHVLDPDLTLDIDGGIYPITSIILEQALGVELKDFLLAPAASLENLNSCRISPLNLLLAYAKTKAWRDPAFRRLIINNIEVGFAVRDCLRPRRSPPSEARVPAGTVAGIERQSAGRMRS